MPVSVVKASQIVVRSMSLNKLYSDFALVTRIKFPFFPRPNLIFTSHTWRHETVHWCITLRRIPVIFKIGILGWLLNIIMNYERIPNQVTHSFGRLQKKSKNFCPSLYIKNISRNLRYGSSHAFFSNLFSIVNLSTTSKEPPWHV